MKVILITHGMEVGDYMQVIIMAGGKYKDFEKHKALSFVRGEFLIERTIRLLKENGIKNWFISSNDEAFEKYGIVLHHNNNYEAEKGVIKGYWVDAFYPTNEPTIYLHGDVYYTDDAMRKILTLNPTVNTLIGNEIARNPQHIDMGEPFGWIIVDQKSFREAIEKTKKLQDEKKLNRGFAISWELYRVMNGLDPNRMFIIDETYLSINDKTIDVDTPEQIDMVNKGLR